MRKLERRYDLTGSRIICYSKSQLAPMAEWLRHSSYSREIPGSIPTGDIKFCQRGRITGQAQPREENESTYKCHSIYSYCPQEARVGPDIESTGRKNRTGIRTRVTAYYHSTQKLLIAKNCITSLIMLSWDNDIFILFTSRLSSDHEWKLKIKYYNNVNLSYVKFKSFFSFHLSLSLCFFSVSFSLSLPLSVCLHLFSLSLITHFFSRLLVIQIS